MAGIEILGLYVAISFFFIAIGYFSSNKIFAFAGGSFMLVLSLILLAYGYDVQSGHVLTTDYTYEGNLTTQTNTTDTNIMTSTKDTYTNAFGLLMLIMSIFILISIGMDRL